MTGAESQKEGVGTQHESDTQPDTQSDTAATVRGVKALALALVVNRSTIYEWLKLPGHPKAEPDGSFSLAKWRDFAARIGSKTDAGQTDTKAALQARELQAICERRELDLAIKRGEYTRNDQISEEIGALVNEAKSVLRAKFERELPPLYSDDPEVQARAKRLNSEALDEVCSRLSEPLPCEEPANKIP